MLAAVAEIGGGAWLVWQGVREQHGTWWIGVAAYGGVFVAGSLAWGMLADGFRPDRWDVAGALICLLGASRSSCTRPAADATTPAPPLARKKADRLDA